ncbi:B2 bradykinin receptor-like [Spea bombifrons]|uniref:B2 bradykinin receptor-like n=1 Tax=Spea bombifrons TaxID=233779 RepID=UPI00234BDB03|nr:B2 bradykinin receptor-like [Spea bombifrons]
MELSGNVSENIVLGTGIYNVTQLSEAEDATCTDSERFSWIFAYQPIYMWVIFVLGFLENSFVIGVFLLHKSRCTVAEIYLGNLAAADLIFVCGLPFWAIYISNEFYWPFGSFLCVFINALMKVNNYASIYFLLMVSIDRYFALVKTMSTGRTRRTSCAMYNCLFIWILSAIMSMPKAAFRVVRFVPALNTTACIIDSSAEWHIASNILLNLIGFVVPLAGISFCTFQIIKALTNNSMQKFKEFNTEKKAARLVFAVVFVFFICWLPFHFFTLLDTLDYLKVFPECAINQVLDIGTQISTYIGYSNSCINPLLYVMVGNHFRKKAVEVYYQFTPRKHRPRNLSLQTDFSADTVRTSISMGQPNRKIF